MGQFEIQSRPLYGIGTVARLTGLKADTLRVWERRYGLGSSKKSNTGRRQYTQSDLEHLQLVSALVKSGSRIGEIATAERKTLEVLLRGQGQTGISAIPTAKPRAVFVGEALCDFLEEHQGCLSHVDATFVRVQLGEAVSVLSGRFDGVDILAVECSTLASTQLRFVHDIKEALQAQRVMVTYQACDDRWLQELQGQDIVAMGFPPEPGRLAFELGKHTTEQDTNQGEPNLGELVVAKPRLITPRELSAAYRLESPLNCKCPKHISELVEALVKFEEYSASCSVDNWQDASIHSCVFAYTGQARWLMERALKVVLEERSEELEMIVREQS